MTEKLPFEEFEREILVRKEAETDPNYGTDPNKRPIEDHIQFGIVNINKPSGPTSHQVSDIVKKILNIKKAGHSGTLDPRVTGSLPIALAKATKVVQTLLIAGKEYVCVMHLHQKVEEDKIREVINEFIGEIEQLPPIKSAVKRQLRKRNIYYLKVLEIDGQDVLFRVGCQAGTYIRKLCLHKETDIITKEGLIKASEFYKNKKTIYSISKGKIIMKIPSKTQKIKSPRKLIKIITSSGIELIMTADHELLQSTKKGYRMTEVKKLKEGDYLAKSLRFPQINRDYFISDLLDDKYLVDQKEIKEQCKKAFIKKYGSIRAMNKALNFDRKTFLEKSQNAITLNHIRDSGIYNEVKSKINTFKTEKGTKIELKKLTESHFYLLGLIASDGNNTKEKGTIRHTRIKFHNKDEVLINHFLKQYKKLFPQFAISKRKIKNDLFEVSTSNSFFATIAASLGVKSPQKNSDIRPLLNFKPEFIRAFLKGYFDGNGTCYFKKKTNIRSHHSDIRLLTVDYIFAKRLHQMLLKIGISSKIFKSKLYIVSLNSLAAKHKFIKDIGTNSLHKKRILNNIEKLFDKGNQDDHFHIGLHYKKYIQEKSKLLYPHLGGNIYRILNSNIAPTKRFYKNCSHITQLPKLDDLIIEQIKKIELVKGEDYVYDMTVPNTHNFLIETGFVSSNCHDMGEKLGTGAHMAELVRTKAGPFTDQTMVTLQDLKDAYETWKENKDETQLRKIILPMETAIQHIPKIWIFDTTVDTLSHGADLSVPGISKLESDINHEEMVAVLTLKNELVALGEAKMNSQNMYMQKKGIAVKINKVFYGRSIYPKFIRE